jgi:hypothetical protein
MNNTELTNMEVWSLNRLYDWLTGKQRDNDLIKQLNQALSGDYDSQDWLIQLWQSNVSQ